MAVVRLIGFTPGALIAARTAAGLSRADLARLAGVRYNSIRRWELGQVQPARDALCAVADALGTTVGNLYDDAPQNRTLAQWRSIRGLTQAEVAAALHTSSSNYSRIERGEQPLTIEDEHRLAATLGISHDQAHGAWIRSERRPPG